MVDKIALETDVEALRAELRKKERLLERVKNANTQYATEPSVGTVIRFSRSIGGTRNYTFVAVRNEPGWSVTGRRNSLNYLGLVEGSTNTWEALSIAIGQSVIEEAVGWDVVKTDAYSYFQGVNSGTVYRTKCGQLVVEAYNTVVQEWHEVETSVSYMNLKPLSRAQARLIAGPKAVAEQ
jgi:hypothetical protein